MNKDEIEEMAKQAGWEMDDSLVLEPEIVWYISQGQLELFAKLIAEKEREECATMSDWILKEGGGTWGDAIRARGDSK